MVLITNVIWDVRMKKKIFGSSYILKYMLQNFKLSVSKYLKWTFFRRLICPAGKGEEMVLGLVSTTE